MSATLEEVDELSEMMKGMDKNLVDADPASLCAAVDANQRQVELVLRKVGDLEQRVSSDSFQIAGYRVHVAGAGEYWLE
jgi:hypothetical protein